LFSNGDCLFATTVAKQIKYDYPDCLLTWAIAESCSSIIKNNPDVDQTIEVKMNIGEDKEVAFNCFLDSALKMKNEGLYSEIFVSQVIGDNFANYDSCVRTSIYRCYGKPITVSKKPVLCLTNQEVVHAAEFMQVNKLTQYKHVILFECAPLSGQVNLSFEFIDMFVRRLVARGDTAIILSSAKKIPIDVSGVIDGSILSIRETIALSEYCELLIGCSSGITWATTSVKNRQIPMVQLLNASSYIFNPPSVGFSKVGEDTSMIIELYQYDLEKLAKCINNIFDVGFAQTKIQYHQPAKSNFKIYRGIIHSFIQKRKINLLRKFIKMNVETNGYNVKMLISILLGIVLFPVQYVLNKIS
jgi:hypothetical protein